LAISKQRKDELVAQYIDLLQQSKGVILADYRGLSVSQVHQIRNTMRPLGGEFHVIKNRLMQIALHEVGLSLPDEWLVGPTAASFCREEVPPIAKAFTDTAKEMEALKIKGGLIGASPVTPTQVNVVADLPPREVLLAQVLGTINAPASQVVGVIASGIRQVMNVLQAYVDKLQEAGGAAEPVAEAA
jgi:large subunit ribosomal protein L10